jgi:hypothetical protein
MKEHRCKLQSIPSSETLFDSPFSSELQCGISTVINGVLTKPTGPFYLGDKVTVKCNSGFKLDSGTGEMTCGSGQTFGTIPKCVGKSCHYQHCTEPWII